MRAWMLMTLFVALPTSMTATQEGRAIDPALVQRFVDADSAGRDAIVSILDPTQREALRVAISTTGNDDVKQGRFQEALRKHEAALDLSGRMGATRSEVIAMINLGQVYGQTGDYIAVADSSRLRSITMNARWRRTKPRGATRQRRER